MHVTHTEGPFARLPHFLRWPQSRVLLLAGILLLATLLRVWKLDGRPLWWDEGNNAYFAHQSIAGVLEMSRATHDTDPPAHRLALALWLRLLGDSAFNLRLFSSVLGVATVLLVYHWGRWLAGTREALLAAALTALSPVLVYYSREAKAYPFVTFFGLLALYLWVRYLDALQKPRPLHWVLYVLAEILAVGAHYYAVFLIVAQGLWVAVGIIRGPDRRRAWGRALRWLGAQVAVGAALLPWLIPTLGSALQGVQGLSSRSALALPVYLRDVFISLGAGPGALASATIAAMLVLGIGALVELVKGDFHRTGLLTCAILVPVFGGYLAQSLLSFFSPRLLVYTAPVLCLVAALGLSRMRRAGLLLTAGLAVAWLIVLPATYAHAIRPEEDLRPLAQVLRAGARPGDGVVVNYVWQEGILRMLAPAAPVTYHLGWFTSADVEEQMRGLFALHPRLWLLTYKTPLQHPQNTGGWWLEQHAARGLVNESGPGRMVLYLAPPIEAAPGAQSAIFEGAITLAYAAPGAEEAAGQPFLVPLSWTLDAPITQGYSVFVHLYDGSGKLWAQNDGAPVNGLKPFLQFARREAVADYRALPLPRDIPPGRYTLAAGIYDPASGKRLKVVSGAEAGQDSVVIGSIQVVTGGR